MLLWSFGQVRAKMYRPDMRTSSIFNTQLQQGGQTRATCRAQQCRDMLRSNVANAGPTMLGYDVSKTRTRGRGLFFIYIFLSFFCLFCFLSTKF